MAVRIPDILKQGSDSDTYKLLRAKDVDVTEATALTSLADADIFIVDDAAAGTQASTKKITAANIKTYMGGGNATTVTITDNESTDEENKIIFGAGAAGSGDIGLEADGDLTYNPNSGVLTAAGGFAGTATLAGTQTISGAKTFSAAIAANAGVNIPNGQSLKTDSITSTTGATNLVINGSSNIQMILDYDANGSGQTFTIGSGGGATAFTCTDGGDVTIGNDLEVNGVLTVKSFADGDDSIINLYSDQGDENSDKWRIKAADGGDFSIQSYSGGSWENELNITNAGVITGTFSATTVSVKGDDDDVDYNLIMSTASPANNGTSTGQDLYVDSDDTFKYNTSSDTLFVPNINVSGTITGSATVAAANHATTITLTDSSDASAIHYIPFCANSAQTDSSPANTLTDAEFSYNPSAQILRVGGSTDGTATGTISPINGSGTNKDGSDFIVTSGNSTGSGTRGDLKLQYGLQNGITIAGATGNVTVAKDLVVSGTGTSTMAGNLTVTGNFTVNGSTTTVSSTNLAIEDKAIMLGTNSAGDNFGATDGTNASTAIVFAGEGQSTTQGIKAVCHPNGFSKDGGTTSILKVTYLDSTTFADANDAGLGTAAPISSAAMVLDPTVGADIQNDTTGPTTGTVVFDGTDMWIYD